MRAEATHWRDDAACLEIGGDLFFTVGESESTYADLDAALDICHNRCPVAQDCLAFGMHMERGYPRRRRFGIFGGTLPGHRWRMDDTATKKAPETDDWTGQVCGAGGQPGDALCTTCGEGVSAGQESYVHVSSATEGGTLD